MESGFVQVARFMTETEAEHYRSILDERGITSFVEGATTASLFGNNALLGSVGLLVSSDDRNAANEIIQSIHGPDQGSTTWYCDDCDEVIEASFDVCWSCGKTRQAGASMPSVATVVAPNDHGSFTDKQQDNDNTVRDLSNPYVSPQAKSSDDTKRPVESHNECLSDRIDKEVRASQQESVQDNITRALRAAIFGFLLLPPLVHIYSLYLLAITTTAKGELSTPWQRKWNWAFSINIASICVCVLVYRSLTR